MGKIELEHVLPGDIERRSFEIIRSELGRELDPALEPVILRVIHTTADLGFADTMRFSDGVLDIMQKALSRGASIVTDTQMAKAGINKKVLERFGGQVYCFMSDEDVAQRAREEGKTRAVASMDKAAETLEGPLIFAIGNAPTALIRIRELYDEKRLMPAAVIGAPVGFVNVVASKELIMESSIPCIIPAGRKGGSNVAASIVNAVLYMMTGGRRE